LRIEYAGAFYHVYSRGNQKQPIFFSDEDRYYFLKILRDANERLGGIVHLYCLMGNHYHLLLETTEANLSQLMHFVNSSYSIYLNTKYGRCGHLFQGRFKAILVQADTYAKTLAFYIHGNPVRKGIVDRPEQYAWSSCKEYYGMRKTPSWLILSVIMSSFGDSPEDLRFEHERYLRVADDLILAKDLKKASRLGILGDDDFIGKIRRTYLKGRIENPDEEICELRRLRVLPDLARIKAEVDGELGAQNKLAKKCAIFLAHKHANYRLREIGDFFGISPTAVSTSFRKTAKEIASNETLRRVVETVRSRLSEDGRNPI